MLQTLSDHKYCTLRRDPAVKVVNRITSTLKCLHNDGQIDEKTRDFLTLRYSSATQMYGLPKVHKEGTPMRPIVSAIGSPSYNLAKELARILTPLASNTPHLMKNSSAFVERVSVMELEARDCLVNFDITNLFTQVPVDEALKVLEERLSADDTLTERTSIPVPQLTKLIEICLQTTFFQFQDTFYEQLDGTAMGSPIYLLSQTSIGAPRGDCSADGPKPREKAKKVDVAVHVTYFLVSRALYHLSKQWRSRVWVEWEGRNPD